MRRERIALIGFGAIGRVVAAHLLNDDASPELAAVCVRQTQLATARLDLPAATAVVARIEDMLALQPDLVVECAGQGAVREFAASVLAAGIPFMLASTGALAAPDFLVHVQSQMRGHARLIIPAGAIAGLDGLGALKIAGLTRVTYTSIKPPRAWKGTDAEKILVLEDVQAATVFFNGTAREAALRFPKNANLAATVALAGLGLDETRVQLIADPHASGNTGRIEADSAIGSMTLTMAGTAGANPKTSASTAFSVLHALRQRAARILI